jgi:hypothetical protein
MASGIKGACNRPKLAKNLRSSTKKKFRNDTPENRAKYQAKINARSARKLKKNRK